MRILSNEQVRYCNLIVDADGTITHLPGVFYQNKLFIKNKFFDLKQEEEALEYGKSNFIATQGQNTYIFLKDNLGFTIWIENSSAKLSAEHNQDIDPVSTINLDELVTKMRHIRGIKIKDRNYKFKTYPKCFIGQEAVKWFCVNLGLSTQQAIQLGQRLMDEKWIHHVLDREKFSDEFLFYRFYWDEI